MLSVQGKTFFCCEVAHCDVAFHLVGPLAVLLLLGDGHVEIAYPGSYLDVFDIEDGGTGGRPPRVLEVEVDRVNAGSFGVCRLHVCSRDNEED